MKHKNFFRVLLILLLSVIYKITYAQDLGNALDFDGYQDYIIGEHFEIPEEFTIEFWYKSDMIGGNGDHVTYNDNGTPENFDDDLDLVSADWYYWNETDTGHPAMTYSQQKAIVTWTTNGDNANNDPRMTYVVNADYGEIVFRRENESSNAQGFSFNSGSYDDPIINNNEWHHFAITKKMSADTPNTTSDYVIYLDGVLASEGTNVNSFWTWEDINVATGNFIIGALQFPNSNVFQHFIKAKLDELRIWNYAKPLTQIQVQMNTELTGNEDNYSNLVAYFKFNEGTADGDNTAITTLINEVGGNGTFSNNFALTGDGSNFVEGVTENDFIDFNLDTENDNALDLDGVDDYAILDHFSMPDQATIEFWIKTDEEHSSGSSRTALLTWSGEASVPYAYEVSINESGIEFSKWDGPNNNDYKAILSGKEIARDNLWHHAAIVKDGTNITFYIDGNQEHSDTISSETTEFETLFLTLGALKWPGTGGTYDQEGKATLDELRIWGVAKSQAEVQNQMLTKLSGSEDNLLAYYPFNQGTANEDNTLETTLIDFSGNNHNGTLANFALDGSTSNWVEAVDIASLFGDVPFITTWQTTTANESITIPINGDYDYDFIVDWGDNSTSDIATNNVNDAALTHTYTNADTYTVTITGVFPAIYFNNIDADNQNKIQTVEQWGNILWSWMGDAFEGCSNLDVYASDAPNLLNVTHMWGMFRDASSFTGQNTDLNSWNVSNVEAFSTLFANSQFNADISNWNLQNADVSRGDFSSIFTNTSLDCSNYSAILIGWGNNTNTASGDFELSGNNFYTASAAAAVTKLVTKGWAINGTEVTVCPSLSINDEVFSNAISVSPNPVTSVLTINGPAGFELKQAVLYSILGKQVLSTTNTTINTSKLISGLYLLKIENTEGLIATKKIIKQ
ncbi:LamG-like jellyroll fold domain-containing protein [Flavivirga aquimarina]|uniref:LamG-like jellyroll fold domain-containing protein n=1 Tax=Flavivirga aquimarina TaxID=2027862 RepID=A0ABT8W8Z1_9FLAO|nr:LamG-like jellyroll fold domain-containing protein [Flavivirga aquimarina]MDO5969548.1 LamG-like jellyroll fold domain-containing protein [Flavivirga aquimarina]